MPEPQITLTREELYEKVWTTPMQKLAAEFGFSDRGLAKLCARHQVPVPPRGYWARLQAGQSIKRTPLPSVADASLGTVEIYPHEKRPTDQFDEMEEQEIPIVAVAGDGPLTHPMAWMIEKWSLMSLQRRLVKTKGRFAKHARCYWLLLAEGHLMRRLFVAMLGRIGTLSLPAA